MLANLVHHQSSNDVQVSIVGRSRTDYCGRDRRSRIHIHYSPFLVLRLLAIYSHVSLAAHEGSKLTHNTSGQVDEESLSSRIQAGHDGDQGNF